MCSKSRVIMLIFGLLLLSAFFGTASATTRFVDDDGGADFTHIQDAINNASAGDTIFAYSGTYYENIILKDGVKVQGEGADVTTIDGGKAGSVVTAIDVGPEAALEGFTITNGSGTIDPLGRLSGGGIYLEEASPVITNNVITQNSVAEPPAYWGGAGGGIYAYFSSAMIAHNTINDNSAEDGGGIFVDNWPSHSGPMPNIEGNNIYGNSARAGGGIYLQFSSPTVRGNTIAANTAVSWAGGIGANLASALIINNVIAHNSAGDYGDGGIGAANHASLLIMNNAIINNTASNGGGGVGCSEDAPATIFNCIIWDNGDDLDGCTATYSDIEDGDLGEGNICADPIFVDPSGGDYHLQAGSPCIDAGTNEGAPSTDFDGNHRPIDGDGDGIAVVDMGAFEYLSAYPVHNIDTGEDFETIQAAIDDSDTLDRHTILVDSGTYYENVVVNKPLTIRSTSGNRTDTIVNGGALETVFQIEADNVSIRDFLITNGNWWGIGVAGADALISGNVIEYNIHGTAVYVLGWADRVSIVANEIRYNAGHGINIEGPDEALISNNKIIHNVWDGIRLIGSSNSITELNDLKENGRYGISVSYAPNNLIYHNNLIDNTQNGYEENPADHDWHHPVLLEGNYWSDYTGVDDGSGTGKHAVAGDGIGDTDIPHPGANYDNYPFMKECGWLIQADLEITGTWLCWPGNCTICYNVTNIGNGTAPSSHNTTLYVDGVAVAHDHVPVDLAPGESYISCFDDYKWAYTPPSDKITVCTDNNEALDELDEGNNCLTNIWRCGDVNCDGKVTMSDVRKVFNRYLDPSYPLDLPWAADVNCDGKVSMSDVRKVFNRYLDLGYDLNCCCMAQ